MIARGRWGDPRPQDVVRFLDVTKKEASGFPEASFHGRDISRPASAILVRFGGHGFLSFGLLGGRRLSLHLAPGILRGRCGVARGIVHGRGRRVLAGRRFPRGLYGFSFWKTLHAPHQVRAISGSSSSGGLQAGRVEPLADVRRSLCAPCPQQQFLPLRTRRKLLGPFTVGLGLHAKPLFQRHGLPETSSSRHDALLSCTEAYACPAKRAITLISLLTDV